MPGELRRTPQAPAKGLKTRGNRGSKARDWEFQKTAPIKVFDNLYWLGTRQHSAWALSTSAGIIVIDTNFAWATQPETIDGLTTLGLDPRQIKYVLISHAHGDHDQGAAELQSRYGAKVVMGAPDWDSTLQRPATAAGGVPKRDIAVGPEGSRITLGDTTVTVVPTPGHTPHHQSILIDGGNEIACYLGDVIPTHIHMPLPWIMGYDVEPLRTLESKRALLSTALAERWLLIFEHDASVAWGYAGHDGKNYFLVPAQFASSLPPPRSGGTKS